MEIKTKMKLIDEKEFEKLYPLRCKISEGTYGRIYESGDYVVKIQDMFDVFLNEINIYSMIDHPCVMKIKHISFGTYAGKFVYYMSLPKGISIMDAYQNKLITIKEIISDIISVLSLMYVNGIGYFDMKENNIIFYDGKANLIDFGLARLTCKASDGDFYDTMYGFADNYKDPQFKEGCLNSIKSDLYAFAKAIIKIYKNESNNDVYPDLNCVDELNTNESNNIENAKNLKDFLMECFKPWDVRKTPCQLLNHFDGSIIVRKYDNTSIKFPIYNHVPNSISVPLFINMSLEIMKYMKTICYDMRAKYFFLSMGLLHRLNEDFISNNYILISKLLVLLPLVPISHYGPFELDVKDISNELMISERKIIEMSMKLVELFGGIVVDRTWYDFANSPKELYFLYKDIIKPSVDLTKIKLLNPDVNNFEYKNIYFDELIMMNVKDTDIERIEYNIYDAKLSLLSMKSHDKIKFKECLHNDQMILDSRIILIHYDVIKNIDDEFFNIIYNSPIINNSNDMNDTNNRNFEIDNNKINNVTNSNKIDDNLHTKIKFESEESKIVLKYVRENDF